MLPDLDRHHILSTTRTLWEKIFASLGPYHRSCLTVSTALKLTLDKLDPECNHHFQAGSCSFRIVPEELDDGECATHFSYKFSVEEAMGHIARGRLPEMHCWVVREKDGEVEIIDMLFQEQPRCMKDMPNALSWHPSLLPQGVLWDNVKQLEDGGLCHYHADANAIGIALTFLNKSWKQLRKVEKLVAN